MNFGNVLVTGGAGFLGSNLVKRLLPLANHIFVIDNLSVGDRRQVPDSEQITFFEESVTNGELLEKILPQVETVFHLACKNLVMSVEDMTEDYQTNLYGCFLLLQKAREYGSRLNRFVYTSTSSVYGNATVIPTPESFYNITFPYSASKFAAEHYCNVYYHLYRFPAVILRLSNVYGPGCLPDNPYAGVIIKFFESFGKREPLTIFGDGKQTRDFTFVDDALDAVLQAAVLPQAIGNTYNVGTGVETSILELADQMMEMHGYSTYPIRFKPKRIVDKVFHRALDTTKIRNELQWIPRYSLREGLSKTYEWYQKK